MQLSATRQESQLITHPNLDLRKYAGLWYEYARLPNGYQVDCTGEVTVDYDLQEDGTLEARFSCANSQCEILNAVAVRKSVVKGKREDAEGGGRMRTKR